MEPIRSAHLSKTKDAIWDHIRDQYEKINVEEERFKQSLANEETELKRKELQLRIASNKLAAMLKNKDLEGFIIAKQQGFTFFK